MAPRTETVVEEFCPWPYFQPYTFERKIPRKKRAPKKPAIAAKAPRKRKAKVVAS